MTLIRSAHSAPRYLLAGTRASARTYVDGAKMGWLAMILPIALVPDVVVIEIFVPPHLLWFRVVAGVLSVYAVVWIWGAYATMVERPHQIDGDRLVFHRGVFFTAVVDARSIEKVDIVLARGGLPSFRHGRDEADIGVPGVGGIRLWLREPACVEDALTGTRAFPHRLVVASDRPGDLRALISAIHSSSHPPPSNPN